MKRYKLLSVVAAALVLVTLIVLIRSWSSPDVNLGDSEPFMSVEGVEEWFSSPDTASDNDITSPVYIDYVVEEAATIWRDAGVDPADIKDVLPVLEDHLNYVTLRDFEALQRNWSRSDSVATPVVQARLDMFAKQISQNDENWSTLSQEDQLRKAIEVNPTFGTVVDAGGEQVLAGIGQEYMNIIPKGFTAVGILASNLPEGEAVFNAEQFRSELSCAIPVTIEGLGDVWLETCMQKAVSNNKWFVKKIVLWVPPGVKVPRDRNFFWAI